MPFLRATERLRCARRDGPLAYRSFRLLVAGQFGSATGDSCYAVALPWLILTGHGSPVLLGMVLACYGVPRTALIPVSGMLSDRVGARPLMLVADAARCVLVGVLAVVALSHHGTLLALGPLAGLTGASEGLFISPSYALLPSLLPPGELQAGNAIASAVTEGGSLIGPALGGPLVAALGPAAAFAVDAASFAVSAVMLALIPGRRNRTRAAYQAEGLTRPTSGPERLWPLIRRARLLQVMLAVVIVANLASDGTLEVAIPSLAHARYGAIGYGTMMACLAAGSVAGNLAGMSGRARGRTLGPVLGRLLARTTPAVQSAASFVLEGVAIMVLPYLGGLGGAATAAFVLGLTSGFGNVLLITLLQQWAPPELLGRVMSLIMLAAWGTLPLSAAVAGALVLRFGPDPYFPVAGAVVAVAVLGALTQREFRHLGVTELPQEISGLVSTRR
ncbi:MAG TPA: MFS transporter [Streptosporangiaceae bacterium]